MKKYKVLSLLVACMIMMSAAVVNNDKLYEISKNIEIFVKVYKELNAQYVDDIDPSKLMKTGIDAMVESLDPYTRYISESEIESYRIQTDKKYDGIGARSATIDGKIVIAEPFEDSPADKAGLKAGDIILKVNGKSTKGKDSQDLNAIVRGLPGTELRLTIERPGQEDLIDVLITRGPIKIKNVPYSGMVSDEVGYISLTTFTADATRNIRRALKNLKKNDRLKGVILDLRFNGGGLLREAIGICNIFIAQGEEVVSTRCKVRERDKHYKTTTSPMDMDIPLVILVNKRSASASEIVSGVLQDMDRAVIMGQRSFGKGLVQNTMQVGYNNRVKVTTSKYYIPSGRCIQGVEYEKGEPVDIPDDMRSVYYTKNKRPVLDGGGVTPDVKLELEKHGSIVKALNDQYMIFNYVTEWVIQRDSIDKIGVFNYEDFNDFVIYLKHKQFTYESESQKLIEKLKQSSKEENIDDLIMEDISLLEAKVADVNTAALMANKKHIELLIESEIVTRYYYQRGKSQQLLSEDQEIHEAITLLNDENRYKSILKIK